MKIAWSRTGPIGLEVRSLPRAFGLSALLSCSVSVQQTAKQLLRGPERSTSQTGNRLANVDEALLGSQLEHAEGAGNRKAARSCGDSGPPIVKENLRIRQLQGKRNGMALAAPQVQGLVDHGECAYLNPFRPGRQPSHNSSRRFLALKLLHHSGRQHNSVKQHAQQIELADKHKVVDRTGVGDDGHLERAFLREATSLSKSSIV
jgi:hypothetical protein